MLQAFENPCNNLKLQILSFVKIQQQRILFLTMLGMVLWMEMVVMMMMVMVTLIFLRDEDGQEVEEGSL